MIDATQAFEGVEYIKLFSLLLKIGITVSNCTQIFSFLLNSTKAQD